MNVADALQDEQTQLIRVLRPWRCSAAWRRRVSRNFQVGRESG
jgi:hypothetical protein